MAKKEHNKHSNDDKLLSTLEEKEAPESNSHDNMPEIKQNEADQPDQTDVDNSSEEKTDTSITHDASVKQSRFSKIRAKLLHPKKLMIVGILLAILAVGGGTAYAIPTSRYILLNTLSNADATVHIVNAKTKLPIAGAKVTLKNGDNVETDATGKAFFNDTEYGKTTVKVEKANYESSTFDVVISKDNIDLGQRELSPNGVPINFEAEDWLSGKKISNFSIFTQNDASTKVDAVDGKITLSIPYETEEALFTINTDGYNEQQITVNMKGSDIVREPTSGDDVTTIHAHLVLSGEHYFISNREGSFGFYESSLDGTHIEKLVATNQKTDYFEYYAIPDTELYAVLLSSTGRSNSGRQDQLAIADLENKTMKVVDEAPGQKLDFSVISADKKKVVYQVIYDAERADKYKLKSYDISSGKLTTHYTTASYFSPTYDTEHDAIYIVQQDRINLGIAGSKNNLLKIDLANNKQSILFDNQAIWYAYITNEKLGKMLVSLEQYYYGNSMKGGYYFLDLADNSKVEYIGADYPELEEPDEIPDSEKGQQSPNKTNRVWLDNRDGKQRLILNESSKVVSGEVDNLSINNIIRWVNEAYVTVNASDGSEVADYIIDVESGNYRKITNSFTPYYGGY